jgi:hypothetical protein
MQRPLCWLTILVCGCYAEIAGVSPDATAADAPVAIVEIASPAIGAIADAIVVAYRQLAAEAHAFQDVVVQVAD